MLGRCIPIPPEAQDELEANREETRERARAVFDRVKQLGADNPMVSLRLCLMRPEILDKLKEAMRGRSENGINRLLRECGADPRSFIDYGELVLDSAPRALAIELGIGVTAGVGGEAGIGYVVPLQRNPDGRFYLTGGVGGGTALTAGGDVGVGISWETVPENHWAKEREMVVNFSGKVLAGGGVSVAFPQGIAVPSGVSIAGGVGLGFEAGNMLTTWTQYLHNY